uniref:Cytochrome c-553 n=1 Tax=Laurenciella marilzae TaxID=1413812 RepID=A0A1Z1M1P9_9FLOR|nr:cytochrome c553 [Laurenciella marilzae]ARW59703.1 cytochrome c553 [Laurenciella marilzae]
MIKFILSLLFSLLLVLFCGLQLVFGQDAAVNLEVGEQVFNAKCSGCHAGGNNVIVVDKTLKIGDLEKNSKDSVDAIITQVTYGNGNMPPFGDDLNEVEIQSVAKYVLNQAKTNSW